MSVEDKVKLSEFTPEVVKKIEMIEELRRVHAEKRPCPFAQEFFIGDPDPSDLIYRCMRAEGETVNCATRKNCRGYIIMGCPYTGRKNDT